MPDRVLTVKLAALAAAMFGFGFALVPLYDAFCALTGLGGKTEQAPAVVTEAVDESRTVRVELLASVERGAPYEFEPTVAHLAVHPGKIYETTYRARNLTAQPLVARAVPSVAPGFAARYLRKIECFCFTTQAFGPNEERELKVVFMIDPKLATHTDTLSLSYTLFAAAN
jgi:cytochrome c oxidase assembly protein subunit 11